MRSPYQDRPSRSFWRTTVADGADGDFASLYRRKFAIDRTMRIATAGSCFAQHIGRALRDRGFRILDAEPGPFGLDAATAQTFGYGLYSARYGNLYTVHQLVQLVKESRGRFIPADAIWEKGGRFYDAMRPSVEPDGLATPDLVRQHRAHHLAAVKRLLRQAEVLVFTLGLTETWSHRDSGTVYPTAPGTIAGNYDPAIHAFMNLSYDQIRADFVELRTLLHRVNPGLRFLLTVSPVPLAATATDDHVLNATIYSKSVLRAVAGSVADEFADVGYFPSYEIVTGSPSRGRYFDDDRRTVTAAGVAIVMRTFFAEHDPDGAVVARPIPAQTRRALNRRAAVGRGAQPRTGEGADDIVCEDILLDGFAR